MKVEFSPPDRDDYPNGISHRNIAGSRRGPRVAPLLLLCALMAAGLAGALGGQPSPVIKSSHDGATLSVKAPHVLRSGLFFEMVIEVRSSQPVDDLVIAVSDQLWRDMTINTMIPAASEESFKQGSHRFSFGKLDAGEAMRFKIDGQINPPLFAGTYGEIAAYDGDRKLVGTQVTMRVLP